MEFIHIPLRNAQSVYAGHYVCCTTNHSQSGQLPLDWKMCKILFPVFKRGVKSEARQLPTNKSYLTDHQDSWESIICDRHSQNWLLTHKPYTSPSTMVFVPRKSCLNQLTWILFRDWISFCWWRFRCWHYLFGLQKKHSIVYLIKGLLHKIERLWSIW